MRLRWVAFHHTCRWMPQAAEEVREGVAQLTAAPMLAWFHREIQVGWLPAVHAYWVHLQGAGSLRYSETAPTGLLLSTMVL